MKNNILLYSINYLRGKNSTWLLSSDKIKIQAFLFVVQQKQLQLVFLDKHLHNKYQQTVLDIEK